MSSGRRGFGKAGGAGEPRAERGMEGVTPMRYLGGVGIPGLALRPLPAPASRPRLRPVGLVGVHKWRRDRIAEGRRP